VIINVETTFCWNKKDTCCFASSFFVVSLSAVSVDARGGGGHGGLGWLWRLLRGDWGGGISFTGATVAGAMPVAAE
jgi:hypothetical protein